MALEKPWHRDCFNCVMCHDNFTNDGQFVATEGQPCCTVCHDNLKRPKREEDLRRKALTTKIKRCATCLRKFSPHEQIVAALNKSYHPKCF